MNSVSSLLVPRCRSSDGDYNFAVYFSQYFFAYFWSLPSYILPIIDKVVNIYRVILSLFYKNRNRRRPKPLIQIFLVKTSKTIQQYIKFKFHTESRMSSRYFDFKLKTLTRAWWNCKKWSYHRVWENKAQTVFLHPLWLRGVENHVSAFAADRKNFRSLSRWIFFR